MTTESTLIRLLPWLLVVGPLLGGALVYLVFPKLAELLASRWLQIATGLAIVIILLLEVRP